MSWHARRALCLRSAWGRSLLWVLSLGYGAAVLVRGFLYDLGLLRSRAVGVRVVCIGNLTTGGTGKTPAALLAALTVRRSGRAVAILSRGYGRPERDREVRVLRGETALTWEQCGDEPWMMNQTLKGDDIPILVSPDRVRAAEQAAASCGSRTVVLDDGFQHRRLRRDLDVVLVNAVDPFGGRRLLPLGNLREPLGALRRAHLIVLTHVDLAPPEQLASLRAELALLNPRAPLLESVHRPDFLFAARTQSRHGLDLLQGRKAATLCGLADPGQFEASLERLGVSIAQRWRYPDHHRYTPAELTSLGRLTAGLPLVTTFKDLVRFPESWRDSLPEEVYVLAVKLEIVEGARIWDEALAGGPA